MKNMAGATGTRRKKQTPQQKKTRPVKQTKNARAGTPSGAVIVLAGATPLRRQKAAEVLAQELQLPLAAVDLSAVVGAHARETEKNVTRVFDMANRHGSILFFDEADALFGKRTQGNEAYDRYANSEASCLLQCIEQHQGLVILATNGKSRIEEAFSAEKPVMVLGGTAKKKASKKKITPAVKPQQKIAKKK